jgi:4-diphosphocytidyl-2-C-methyl-D-erythritol kinase
MYTGEDRLTIPAPAKINLFLDILGKRADGYHNLRSLVVPVSLADELSLERTEGPVTVTCDGAELPAGQAGLVPGTADNLAGRAATRLREVAGCRAGVRIHIRKRIPVGGGMGGGSADAAAVLVGANALWGTGLDRAALMRLGAELGSDIPALVCGGAVCMEGRGERVSPVACRWPSGTAWWLVLVNPGFSVPTADVYRRFRTGLTSADETFTNAKFALESGAMSLAVGSLHNALERVVFVKYPLLRIVAERLKAAGALGVLLSGSGASVFALAAGRRHAEQVEGEIRREAGPWLWTRVAQVLPDGVMVAHGPLEARV